MEEVNFWQPSPIPVAVPVGTPWLFKLHAPHNMIVGGGFFTHYTRMPAEVAWEAFEKRNGAISLFEMLNRIAGYRKLRSPHGTEIGCVVLSQPFFLPEESWVPVPLSWKRQTQRYKRYARNDVDAAPLWDLVMFEASRQAITASPGPPAVGKPLLILPRLGQGGFRAVVTDIYARRCAVTGERTVPALEAAHIKPFRLTQQHEVRNGLLLRSDIHRLFDLGYVSVQPDHHFRVSKSIRDEFENGRDYYALDRRAIRLPENPAYSPSVENLEWHYEEVFRK